MVTSTWAGGIQEPGLHLSHTHGWQVFESSFVMPMESFVCPFNVKIKSTLIDTSSENEKDDYLWNGM